MNYPRTITVLDYMDINFAVHEGELSHAPLRWNEMLGQVAKLTIPSWTGVKLPIFRMYNADDVLARMQRMRGSKHSIWQRDVSSIPPREITIVVRANGFDIHRGDKFSAQLCWDEMIGQMAAMTIPRSIAYRRTLFDMLDADELLWGRNNPEPVALLEEKTSPAYCCAIGQQLGLENRGCPDCVANFGEIPL